MNNNLRHRAVAPPASGERLARRRTLPSNIAKRNPRRTQRPVLPRLEKWQVALLAIALSSASLIAGGVWLSLKVIFSPDSVSWLLPENRQIPIAKDEPPQTQAQIEASIRKEGLIPAVPLPIEISLRPQTDKQQKTLPKGLFFPVMKPQPCPGDSSLPPKPPRCQQIAEIRVYQPVRSPAKSAPGQQYFQRVSQLAVEGPAESSVLAAVGDAQAPNGVSYRPLPLTSVKIFDRKVSEAGIWFKLSGQRRQGDTNITYGLIGYYNPSPSNLSVTLEWTSPVGHQPDWQEVTGGGSPELVIDRTNGIEPDFSIYQVQPQNFLLNPFELAEISLTETALNKQAYKNALLLARNGIWSPALKLMESVKQDSKKAENWPEAAQAQLDLMRFHAQITQMQANVSWPNPSQQMLTALMDGRWKEALDRFEAELQTGDEMTNLLTSDAGRLWNRVEAALRVNPAEVEVRAWGALILATKQGQEKAIAWLDKEAQGTPEGTERIKKLLARHSEAIADAQRLMRHTSKIVGSASVLPQVNLGEWLQPQPSESLQLQDGQVWYQVQIAGFNDSKSWRQSPFADIELPKFAPGNRLWKELGLHNDPTIEIVVWMPDGQKQTVMATVKALQLKGGDLQLLAAGQALPSVAGSGQVHPLAVTASALEWKSPQTLTLAMLNQQQPEWLGKILPVLWVELQAGGELPPGLLPNSTLMLGQIGEWLMQSIDLTGNGLPEAVVTLRSVPSRWPTSRHAITNSSRTRTLIFDDTGALIYSELTTAGEQSVTGIADLRDGLPPALIVEGTNGYSLQRWSAERKRFEF